MTEKISVEDARKIIVEEPKRLMRSAKIEEEAFYRLRKYPQRISENMHCALVTIPRKIAYLLHQKPAYISPAVEAFYTRDPIALRPLKAKGTSNLTFPPEDLVTVSAKFTRVGYAQLKSQDFPAPQAWIGKLPSKTDRKAYARAETGMKVTCGFEMFVSDPQNQDKAAVREIKMLLEDIDTGDEKLPTDEEIKSWDHREDDEKWLDISYDDLESELRGKARDRSAKPGAFGDQNAQENLRRIVARFEEFLNDDSADIEGAHFLGESDTDDGDDDDELSSDGEDKDLGFHEGPRPSGRVEELDSESEEDDSQQIEELARQMEAELRPTGVLDLNDRSADKSAGKGKSVKGKAPMRTNEGPDQDDNSESEVDDAEADEDINVNLAKNLLESLQSQAGMPGPGGNLIGIMGMKMPRDDRG